MFRVGGCLALWTFLSQKVSATQLPAGGVGGVVVEGGGRFPLLRLGVCVKRFRRLVFSLRTDVGNTMMPYGPSRLF